MNQRSTAIVHVKRWKECKGIKIPAICTSKTIIELERRGKSILQESAFLQQSRHLLVLTFPGFPFQAKVPEKVTQISPVLELP